MENREKKTVFALVLASVLFSAAALVTSVVALMVSLFGGKTPEAQNWQREVFEKVRPSCAQVYGGGTAGSGVVYSVDGDKAYVVTNHHVTGEGESVYVRFSDYGERYKGTLLGYDDYHDIAVVETFCEPGTKAADVRTYQPQDADRVLAVGNNLGYGIAAYDGIISRASRMLPLTSSNKVVPVYAVTCPVNEGMSGGGLFDARGTLVGINTYQTESKDGRDVDGVSYSVPFTIADSIVRQALKERSGGQISKLYVSGDSFSDADRTADVVFTALSFTARYTPDGLQIVSVLYSQGDPPFEMSGGAPLEGDIVQKIGHTDVNRDTGYAPLYAECFNYINDPSLESEPIAVTLLRDGQSVTVKYSNKQRKNY